METQPVGTSLAYDYSFRSVSFSSLTGTVVRRTQHQTKSQDYCRFIRFLSCVTAPPIDPFHVFTFHSSPSFSTPAAPIVTE